MIFDSLFSSPLLHIWEQYWFLYLSFSLPFRSELDFGSVFLELVLALLALSPLAFFFFNIESFARRALPIRSTNDPVNGPAHVLLDESRGNGTVPFAPQPDKDLGRPMYLLDKKPKEWASPIRPNSRVGFGPANQLIPATVFQYHMVPHTCYPKYRLLYSRLPWTGLSHLRFLVDCHVAHIKSSSVCGRLARTVQSDACPVHSTMNGPRRTQ